MKRNETVVELAMFLLAIIAVANGVRAGHALFAIMAVILGYYVISVGAWLLKRR